MKGVNPDSGDLIQNNVLKTAVRSLPLEIQCLVSCWDSGHELSWATNTYNGYICAFVYEGEGV